MKAIPLNENTYNSRLTLRLICTKQLPREDWLAVRKQGIGSSDAGAAVGLNPYKSQLELWLEKSDRYAALPKIDSNDEESPAYWGNVLEPIGLGITANARARKCDESTPYYSPPDPELPRMLTNIGREVNGADDVQILECKTAGINGARLWKEDVP